MDFLRVAIFDDHFHHSAQSPILSFGFYVQYHSNDERTAQINEEPHGIQAPPRLPPLPQLPQLREGDREGGRRARLGDAQSPRIARQAPHSLLFEEYDASCGVFTSRPRPSGRGQARAG